MRGHVDEAEYLKENDDEEVDETNTEGKDQVMKFLKSHLFGLFFRLNTMKLSIAIHYHMAIIAIEGFQLLSIVLNDGSYSSLGPYAQSSP